MSVVDRSCHRVTPRHLRRLFCHCCKTKPLDERSAPAAPPPLARTIRPRSRSASTRFTSGSVARRVVCGRLPPPSANSGTVTKPIRAKKAIILAAGAGRRLGSFTDAHPKPLLEIKGTPILGNCLTRLKEAGVEEAVLVIGHFKDQIRAFAGANGAGLKIRYIESDRYATTNNIYSLWLARRDLNA